MEVDCASSKWTEANDKALIRALEEYWCTAAAFTAWNHIL
jgi:hypothetical protein